MRIFFNYVSSGISFLLLYVFVVFLTPILLMLLGYSEFNSNPTILGYPLYVIHIEGNNYEAEATGTGSLLSFVLGLLIYLVFHLTMKRAKTSKAPKQI